MTIFYVYVLAMYKEDDDGNLHYRNMYVGQTNDLNARLDEHIENVEEGDTSHYTGRFDFLRRVWYQKVYGSRGDALALERHLKQMSPPERIEYMQHHGWRELRENFWRNKEYLKLSSLPRRSRNRDGGDDGGWSFEIPKFW